ncbi:MAG: spermidine/putrescine ABC transporter substrate-binding protein PotF [Rhodospirillaceae bacterium]|nr:MAG: spermidine/putrescine ABC transporter substrate-binding protein PotF [Rhodospirillaceae bacterium]
MKQVKKTIAVTVALAAGLVLAGCGDKAEEKVVNVYNWSDYIAEEVLAEFEAETGIKVVYDVFDSNDVLETKLLAGNSGYDVVVPSGTFLGRQIEAGVFQKLDKSKLTNWGNLWDVVLKRVDKYDPGNQYAVNYMWGTTGIGYNVGQIKARMPDAPTTSWDMIFNPAIVSKFADCGVYMLDASDEMIPAALNYIGEDPDSKDEAVIAKAEAVLMAIRPYVRKFHSSEYIDALANGDICLAIGWSGDVLQARDRAAEANNGVEIAYFAPSEGAQMWFDMMAIPADAPHADNAHTFINYIMRAKVMAQASNYVYYANGNKASEEFLEADVIGDEAIYPSAEAMKGLFITTPYDPKSQRAVTSIWTRVKVGE